MKYRVRADLSFEGESDARGLMLKAQELLPKASIINPGDVNEEIGFCDLEICGQDEGKPSVKIERTELKTLQEHEEVMT